MKLLGIGIFWFFAAFAWSETLEFEKQRVQVHFEKGFSDQDKAVTLRWLQDVHQALMLVYGKLPQDSLNISITLSKRSGSAVPWGQVKRTRPNQVLLTVNPSKGYQSLISDWTLFHELSHLLIPYRGWGELWLSEGLASYYQNILQARGGYLDEARMWQKLVAGFERGSSVADSQLSLKQAGDNRARGQIMRMYWSGALFWLMVDVDLRRYHDSSLDQFLAHLNLCCQHQHLSAASIVSKLVEFADNTAFEVLFLQFRRSTRLPPYKKLLRQLGVEGTSRNIQLLSTAPQSILRRNLYLGM